MTFLLLLCLAISSANSMTFFGPEAIAVNFCCREDEALVLVAINSDKRGVACVGNGGGKSSLLEGKRVWVGGDQDQELKSLKPLEVRMGG